MAEKRALFSVSDRRGIVDFGVRLANIGIEILSTGGTAGVLREGGVSVTDIAEVTGLPEMMEGRIKTLHPRIHGGLLARRDHSGHMADANRHGIQMIDLVAVNLYPFEETVARRGVTIEEAVEQIDIGGPAMVRSAAKNYAFVAVIVDPDDYPTVAEELEATREVSKATRTRLCVKAFQHIAHYDRTIGDYLSRALA